MAFSPSAPTSSYFQSSIFQPIKLYPILSSWLKPKRPTRNRLRIRAAATLESANGAAVGVAPEKPISYGRQYFPLAAVVGQVLLLSLSITFSFAS